MKIRIFLVLVVVNTMLIVKVIELATNSLNVLVRVVVMTFYLIFYKMIVWLTKKWINWDRGDVKKTINVEVQELAINNLIAKVQIIVLKRQVNSPVSSKKDKGPSDLEGVPITMNALVIVRAVLTSDVLENRVVELNNSILNLEII